MLTYHPKGICWFNCDPVTDIKSNLWFHFFTKWQQDIKSFSPPPHIKIKVTPFSDINLSLLSFAKCQLVPLLQMGGQKLILFFPSALLVLNALSISALPSFLFFSCPNIPTSASLCSLTRRLVPHTVLQRGDARGRGAVGAES